ncbi:MAG: carbohydrate ABC transporter permease [Candidatus Brocadiia bacterium]
MPDARGHRRTALAWLRYRGWTLAAHLVLLGFGLANLYPFIWMLGTSLKAEEEASLERQSPVPQVKYSLADGAGAAVPPDLSRAQLGLLATLRKPGVAVSLEAYMHRSGRELEAARRELEALVARGLLEREDPATYRLAASGTRDVAGGLNARQLLMLLSLDEENQRRRENRATFAEDSWPVGAYAKKYRVSRERAAEEIGQMVERGLLVPGRAQPVNYWVVLKEENFILHFLTSLVVTVAVVFLTVLSTSMLGYALARMSFPGKMLVLGLMLAGAVAPREAVIIPIFRLLKSMGALEGLWGMVLWLTGVGIGNAFLMAGFFLTLPREVEEAAAVDGAGAFRTFFDVALPMARPIVMTVGLFAFLTAWNNFLIPLLCTVSQPSMQPLAVAVYNFQRGHPGKWHQINAAAAVMIVPVILLFLVLQRHIVRSIAVGAVKA